jgi:hypothetical protein
MRSGFKNRIWVGTSDEFKEQGRFAIIDRSETVVVDGRIVSNKKWLRENQYDLRGGISWDIGLVAQELRERFKGLMVVWDERRAR